MKAKKSEARNSKSPSSEVKLLRRTGETNSNDRNTKFKNNVLWVRGGQLQLVFCCALRQAPHFALNDRATQGRQDILVAGIPVGRIGTV